MFDVAGLPENEDGEPVFKMSYNSRTECNVCYDVKGAARVRMAQHPYRKSKQLWSPWFPLDGDSTYHLNETAGSPEEECLIDKVTGIRQFFRNKHEVHIVDGHVTLFCLFDPAPTGIERHRPGEYSDYEPLSQVIGTGRYETHQRELVKYDEMLDRLSLAKATGELGTIHETPIWNVYLQGRQAQAAIESDLPTLIGEGASLRKAVRRGAGPSALKMQSMRVAIMQPYLFPYLGYYQLAASVDRWVFHDDVMYIKQGYINRNQYSRQRTPPIASPSRSGRSRIPGRSMNTMPSRRSTRF